MVLRSGMEGVLPENTGLGAVARSMDRHRSDDLTGIPDERLKQALPVDAYG